MGAEMVMLMVWSEAANSMVRRYIWPHDVVSVEQGKAGTGECLVRVSGGRLVTVEAESLELAERVADAASTNAILGIRHG